MTDETFGTWLHTQLDTSLEEVRLSLQDERGWLTPDQLGDDTEYTFTLRDNGRNPAEQHHLLTDSAGELRHERWIHYEYVQAGVEEAEFRTRLILELPLNTESICDRATESITLTAEGIQALEAHEAIRSTSADRVAGLDTQKRELRQFLQMSNVEWGLADRTGMLLEGPPGTGKTELVIETCQEEYSTMPVTISGPEILSKWVGESERSLRKKFDEARNADTNVLYIDEIDAIARSRSEASQEHSAQLVAQLLVLLDGVDAKTDDAPKVIASTNLSEVLDPALLRPGRLGNEPISFPRPDHHQRQAIIHHYIEQVRRRNPGHLTTPLQELAEQPTRSKLLTELGEETEGFTGADIEDVFIEAAVNAQSVEEGQKSLSIDIVRDVIKEREIHRTDFYDVQWLVETEKPKNTISFEGSGNIAIVDDDVEVDPRDLANAWAAKLNDSRSEPLCFREVTLSQLLTQDAGETRDRIVEVFQRNADDGLCVYIDGLPRLLQMEDRTTLADTALEAIHEQLLRWNEDNLLLHGNSGESVSRLSGQYRDYTVK